MYQYVKRGRLHKKMNLACQDAVGGGEEKGILVITAADASSMNDYGEKGARLAVETLKELLLYHFDEVYQMSKRDIQYNVIIQVRKKQYEFCDLHGIEIDDIKSTLMAFAYERKTRRIIMLHLGDGYIVTKSKERYRIVSYPQNGGNLHRTYMTSMVPVSQKIKVYCGMLEDLQEVYLLTDGWREFANTNEAVLKIVQKIDSSDKWEGEDDLGFISMNVDDEKIN